MEKVKKTDGKIDVFFQEFSFYLGRYEEGKNIVICFRT